jgi:hypothetical protein
LQIVIEVLPSDDNIPICPTSEVLKGFGTDTECYISEARKKGTGPPSTSPGETAARLLL